VSFPFGRVRLSPFARRVLHSRKTPATFSFPILFYFHHNVETRPDCVIDIGSIIERKRYFSMRVKVNRASWWGTQKSIRDPPQQQQRAKFNFVSSFIFFFPYRSEGFWSFLFFNIFFDRLCATSMVGPTSSDNHFARSIVVRIHKVLLPLFSWWIISNRNFVTVCSAGGGGSKKINFGSLAGRMLLIFYLSVLQLLFHGKNKSNIDSF
jgi:hypothetical protein